MNGNDFVGKGWRFPINVNARGGINWSEGPERVSDAIWVIIKTSLGERVMRPNFGAGVNDYVFQPNSSVTRTELVTSIKQALLKWEPRIDLQQVSANPVPGEPSHHVACLLEADVRRRLWAQLQSGRTPEQALAEVGPPGALA